MPKGIFLQLVTGTALVAHWGEVLEIDGIERASAFWEKVIVGLANPAVLALHAAIATIGAFSFVVSVTKGL